jgi:hypothetical protein
LLSEDKAKALARTSELSLKGAERIVRHTLPYAAQPYSVARLLAQGYEKLTGEPVTMKFGPGHVICSALVALPYWVELGTRFEGKHWRRCTPDDIGDHVQKNLAWRFAWIIREATLFSRSD